MLKHKNLLFYSTSSYISYVINSQFYGQHFLWCSPVFNPAGLDRMNPLRNISTTSSPHDIYNTYKSSVVSNDGHSSIIKQNREGIKRGAIFKRAEGIITDNELQIINLKVDRASISDFRPVIYLIPASPIINKIELVSVEEIANPLGTEYRIKDLVDGEFEIIEFI